MSGCQAYCRFCLIGWQAAQWHFLSDARLQLVCDLKEGARGMALGFGVVHSPLQKYALHMELIQDQYNCNSPWWYPLLGGGFFPRSNSIGLLQLLKACTERGQMPRGSISCRPQGVQALGSRHVNHSLNFLKGWIYKEYRGLP